MGCLRHLWVLKNLKLFPCCGCSTQQLRVSRIALLMSSFSRENLSKCQQHRSWDIALNTWRILTWYMCFKMLACDNMIDCTGFHHILTSYAFVHVSNILYFTVFLISSTKQQFVPTFASQYFKHFKWEEQSGHILSLIKCLSSVITPALAWDHHACTEETLKVLIATQLAAFAPEDIAESCNYGLDEESR